MANPKGQPKQFWRQVAVAFPCEVCDAAPGKPCNTESGAVKFEVHACRSRLAAANNWDHPDAES